MPSTYIPSETFKEGTEKDWPAKLGALDWDSTRIVFTKRTLIEFLRYTGTSVDPNFRNIAKLPGFASFGHLEDKSEASVPAAKPSTESTNPTSSAIEFKPSRRVRTAPGGDPTFSFEGELDGQLDDPVNKIEALAIADEKKDSAKAEKSDQAPSEASVFKPSRRVRTGPGGHSSMADIFGDGSAEVQPFKPTRRVREGPGGTDSISQIF